MKSLTIFALILIISRASAFELRGVENGTLQQELFMPVMQENKAGLYTRITNGLIPARNQFSYQADLQIRRQGIPYIGGGSVISHEWVLTAAQCTYNAEMISVYLGTTSFPAAKIVHHIYSFGIISHAKYNPTTNQNDIGLIRIPSVKYSSAVSIIPLPPRNYPPYIGLDAVLPGRGYTSDSSNSNPLTLRYAIFRVISNFKCARIYGREKIDKGKLCTSTSNRVSGCEGDFGDPLVLKKKDFQIGIFSFSGSEGCELGLPNAFTRVLSYLDWISEHTRLKV